MKPRRPRSRRGFTRQPESRPISTLAIFFFDFGQFRTSANFDFGQFRLRPAGRSRIGRSRIGRSRASSRLHPREQHFFVPRAGLWQVSRSVASRLLQRLVLSPRSSACCSSDVSGAPCPCPRQVAGVAVHSIQVATTAQLVRTQGFWAGGCSSLRAREHACAERPGRE